MGGMFKMFLKLVLVMIFLHIIEDFKLQGIMAELKQKVFWEKYQIKNDTGITYKNDYWIILLLHGFQNSFFIHIPVYLSTYITGIDFIYVAISCLLYTFIHACIDHLKCNLNFINLTQDQIAHLIWILTIAYTFVK